MYIDQSLGEITNCSDKLGDKPSFGVLQYSGNVPSPQCHHDTSSGGNKYLLCMDTIYQVGSVKGSVAM
jgi:hypothetical protein